MKRIYLDEKVFISFFNKEIGRNFRGLFVEAEAFFENLRKEDVVVVLSELFFKEVKRFCYLERNEVLGHFEKNRITVETIKGYKDWMQQNSKIKGCTTRMQFTQQ